MRARLASSLAVTALLGLAACATPNATPTATALVEPTSSAPQPIVGYDWFFHEVEGEAKLAYGLANSDDLRIGLVCTPGSGRLELTRDAPAEAKAEIYVESGGETETYAAEAEHSELSGGVFLTAEARTADPVFQRFRRVGWLAIWHDGEREVYAPHTGSAAGIERFFGACG